MTRHGRRTALLGALLAFAIPAAPAVALTQPSAARITHGPLAGHVVVTAPTVHNPAAGGRTDRVRIVVRDHAEQRIASTVKRYPVHHSERITAPHHIVLTRKQSRRARAANRLQVSVKLADDRATAASVSTIQDTPFPPPHGIYRTTSASGEWAQVALYVSHTGSGYAVSAIIAHNLAGSQVNGAVNAPIALGSSGYAWSGTATFTVPGSADRGTVATNGTFGADGLTATGGWADPAPYAPPFDGQLTAAG